MAPTNRDDYDCYCEDCEFYEENYYIDIDDLDEPCDECSGFGTIVYEDGEVDMCEACQGVGSYTLTP